MRLVELMRAVDSHQLVLLVYDLDAEHTLRRQCRITICFISNVVMIEQSVCPELYHKSVLTLSALYEESTFFSNVLNSFDSFL